MDDLIDVLSKALDTAKSNDLEWEFLHEFLTDVKSYTSLDESELKAMVRNALYEWDM